MGKAFDHYLESLLLHATNKGAGNTSVKMLLVCDHARSPSVSLLNSTSVLNDDDDSNYPFLVCRSREEGDLYESGNSTSTSTSAGVRAGVMGEMLDTRWETSTSKNDHPPSVDGLHSPPRIRRKRDSPKNRRKQEQRHTTPRKLPPHSPPPRRTFKTTLSLSTLPESLRTLPYKDCVDPFHTRTLPPSSTFPLTLVADISAEAALDAIPPPPPPGPISSPPNPSSRSHHSHHSRHSHHSDQSVPSSPRPRREYAPSRPIFGIPNSPYRKKTIEVDQLRKKCSDSLHLTF
jgi:hypothetical protein